MTLKLKQHLIAFIVVCILYESVISQRGPTDSRKSKPKLKPRPRTRQQRGRQPFPEESTVQRTNCYFCSVTFATNKPRSLDINNLCYNPAKNFTAADIEYLTACSQTSRYCAVDITRVGGGLVTIDRKCGGSTCNYFCSNKAYGVEVETCTHCCPGKPVITPDQLEEGQVIPPYKCP